MTERQREDDRAINVMRQQNGDHLLSQQAEQALLKEAHEAGVPTLAPKALSSARTSVSERQNRPVASASFGKEFATLVRRYPLPAALLGVGALYLLMRKR